MRRRTVLLAGAALPFIRGLASAQSSGVRSSGVGPPASGPSTSSTPDRW